MNQKEFCNKLQEVRPRLLSRAYTLTKNRDDAEDLVQDVSFKALKHFHRITDFSQINGWFFTILQNTFINEYRRKSKANTIIDVTPDLFHINLTEEKGSISPESAYQEKELLNLIGLLDIKMQKPFQMHMDGFKYEEIAETLDVKIGTVKSRIFFARAKLIDAITNNQITMRPKSTINEIAKANIKEKLETALKTEGISTASAARIFGAHAAYLTMIKNPNTWGKCPASTWESVLTWVNSGQKLAAWINKNGKATPAIKEKPIEKEAIETNHEPLIKIKPGVLEKRQEEIAKKDRRASRGEMVDMLIEEKELLRAKIEAIDTLLKHYIS